jgi:ADP-ribose pyrophosphatase
MKAEHTKRIYQGRIVTLDLDTVILPNGATVELEMIHHPGAAAIVPIKENGVVILIRQYRYAAGGYIYEIPAGKLHPGEDPKLCAARELEEEIGYRAGSLELLGSILTTPGFTDEVIHIYKGTSLALAKQNLDHDEVIEIVEMPLEKALGCIRDGTIKDAKTIIGLQAVYLRREEKPAQNLDRRQS